MSDLEAAFAAPDFYAKPRSEIFELETAIESGTRQSRAPLRALAGTRAPAERPISLKFRFLHHVPLAMASLQAFLVSFRSIQALKPSSNN